ncbi:phage tail protein [Streptacidiphilus melanogenes]|uniref:phage tail protein n=1 Tax=Streptacidiphilus melanogenes TaxID=411235 RepID=UPI000A002809|nr:phage tail protein [Streptacidiphilus melanogenes]
MAIVRPLLGAAEEAQNLGDSLTMGMTHRFAVMIDNYRYHFGDWSRVTGLSVTWQQVEHRVGSQGNHSWIFPGTTRYEPITLSRSAGPGSRIVQSWLSQTSKAPRPQSGTIQLLGFGGVPLVSWRLSEFFPIAWGIESFDAAGAKPAIETLKLAHNGFLDDDMALDKS